MIKLPKEIKDVFKRVEKKGYTIYAVGGCVRDSIMGMVPYDWDLTTETPLNDLVEIFPEATVLSEKYQVVRIDLTDEEDNGLIIDIARMRTEKNYDSKGNPKEIEFTNNIEEDLSRRDFTINAVAVSPTLGVNDPFGGRGDINSKIIRAVGDPFLRYKEDPLRMFRAIRIAAQLDLDVSKNDYEAILANANNFENVSIDKIRKEFEEIIISDNAGKGLRMLAGADLMPILIGDAANNLSRRQSEMFSTLADNMDKTQKNLLRRLGLFYLCFEKKKGLEAIKVLNYDNKTIQHFTDALTLLDRLNFLRKGVELKEWIFKYGADRFYYMHNLTKAQRIVYDLSEVKVASRHYILKDIEARKEPIFVEDLAITGKDIIDAGIAEGEKVGEILLQLVDVVHRRPDHNNKMELLKQAQRFSKSKIISSTRKVKWIR